MYYYIGILSYMLIAIFVPLDRDIFTSGVNVYRLEARLTLKQTTC